MVMRHLLSNTNRCRIFQILMVKTYLMIETTQVEFFMVFFSKSSKALQREKFRTGSGDTEKVNYMTMFWFLSNLVNVFLWINTAYSDGNTIFYDISLIILETFKDLYHKWRILAFFVSHCIFSIFLENSGYRLSCLMYVHKCFTVLSNNNRILLKS